MNEFIEWLKGLDYTAIYTMLAAFVTAYGGSIVVLVIGLLKQRTKNFNFQQALEKSNAKINQEQTEKIEALRNDIVNMFTEIQKNIIINNNTANEERMAVINQIVEEANASVEELKQLTADESLKGLN
jgi:hypothetical protein